MNSRENWKNNIRTIGTLIENLIRAKLKEDRSEAMELNRILQLVQEYDITNITVGDITVLMKRQLGENAKLDDEGILEFIKDEQNREALITFGIQKNPIDTSLNDAENYYQNRDIDDYEPSDYESRY